jgi:hypothetical protein
MKITVGTGEWLKLEVPSRNRVGCSLSIEDESGQEICRLAIEGGRIVDLYGPGTPVVVTQIVRGAAIVGSCGHVIAQAPQPAPPCAECASKADA